jgi:hypothetical protein
MFKGRHSIAMVIIIQCSRGSSARTLTLFTTIPVLPARQASYLDLILKRHLLIRFITECLSVHVVVTKTSPAEQFTIICTAEQFPGL